MTERVQCPFCFAHPRVKGDGTMYAHNWGRTARRCPGAGKTRDDAREAKRGGAVKPSARDRVGEVRPEDVF